VRFHVSSLMEAACDLGRPLRQARVCNCSWHGMAIIALIP
jgi:hypothetical protein